MMALALKILGLAAVVTVAVIVSKHKGSFWSRRTKDLEQLAKRLNLHFKPESDMGLPARLQFLDSIRRGDARYAFNLMEGNLGPHAVLAFDYHYAGHAERAGKVMIHPYFTSVLVCKLAGHFRQITIASETWKSRFKDPIAGADINFESAEFSRVFCVRSKDKRFAYDVCNAQMIEYLLANRDLSIEIEQDTLALTFEKLLPVSEIENNLNRLVRVRELLPQYLFNQNA